MANTQNFGISTSSNEWPESDGVLDIDFAQFESHDAQVPQPNLRVSSFPRTAAPPAHSPSSSGAAASSPPPRPPRNCPGPLRRSGEETQSAAVAGRKRARDVEDDVDEVTGSLDLHMDQSHHYLGLPLSADCFTYAATATWEEESRTRAEDNTKERLPSLGGPTNAEPCFLAGRGDGHEDAEDGMDCRNGTESGLQQQHDGHYDQFLPEDAQTLWMDQQSLPLGSETAGWDDAQLASDILAGGYEHHTAHNHRLHVLDVGSRSVADMTYQQLAATGHTSHQQTIVPLEAQDSLFQLPGPACGENSTHQGIHTYDNSIVKPQVGHHDDRLGPQASAGEHRSEPLSPWHTEPFPFHECNAQFVHDAWQTGMASASDNTVMSTLAIGNDESVQWSYPEGWPSPFSASLVPMEDQKAAGLGDGDGSYEASNYFDGG
ncbi:hypothetical protein E4U42_001317 [Claviceps africana]|uniref:Uncharacterized protein n=1 Tax=Claviceps africana TaxID=83212 RepID=A0A8K0J1S4_9HYPO|nr:hypothetical protein E4U42_001317 [Claviceps africana]